MTPLRLVFMGTADFATPALAALAEAGHDIACVYSQPPRPAGRGQKERRSPVHEYALGLGLDVRTPGALKEPAEQRAFAQLAVDVAVVVAYGLILPGPILEAPRFGCLNLHASLLPRWRGAAPIQRAIMAGDRETGVSVMQMDEGLDTGAVGFAERVPITDATTAQSLHDQLADLGAGLMVRALADLAEGRLETRPQPDEGTTYARKITKDEGRLDWRQPAAELDRLVRALAPSPGAWVESAGERVKVHDAEVVADVAAPPGTILDDRFTVACGVGALRLTRVQRQGKAVMDAAAFLRGASFPPGAVLD